MKKILHKLTYAQNPSQYEAHPSYYEEILCKVLTVYIHTNCAPVMRSCPMVMRDAVMCRDTN